MPFRYEDRYTYELRALAVKRGIPNASTHDRETLIRLLRGDRQVSPAKGGINRSVSRIRRFKSCIKKVSKKPKLNPYAICNVSVYGSKPRKKM